MKYQLKTLIKTVHFIQKIINYEIYIEKQDGEKQRWENVVYIKKGSPCGEPFYSRISGNIFF